MTLTPRQRIAALEKPLPGSTKQFRRRIVRRAYKISQTRSGSTEYNDLIVTSIIRGSIREIRAGLNSNRVSKLFKPEVKCAPINHVLPDPDPLCYLMPNETWAGKGSGGKTNFSATL